MKTRALATKEAAATGGEHSVAATFRSPDKASPAYQVSRTDAGPTRSPTVAATLRSPNEATFARPWLRKRNRLSSDSYKGQAVFLTMVTHDRAAWFTESSIVREVELTLTQSAARTGFELLAYVFMPEHLHVLALAGESGALSDFLKDFKQRTGFHFKRRVGKDLWQKGAFDHALRTEEDLASNALYIAMNPVRRGITDQWTSYPYWGGVLLTNFAGDLKVAATSMESRP